MKKKIGKEMTELRGETTMCPECSSDNIERLDHYYILANSNYRCKDCGYWLDNYDDLPGSPGSNEHDIQDIL